MTAEQPFREAAECAAINIAHSTNVTQSEMMEIIAAEFAPLAERLAQLEADNLMLVQERAKLREACEGLLEIAGTRWRSLPADSPEKKRIDAARAALASCQQEPKPQ